MKSPALVLMASLFACAGDGVSQPEPAGEEEETPGGVVLDDTSWSPARRAPGEPPEEILAACRDDAEFDFQVVGKGLSAWEGRRVVAAAIENDITADPTLSKRVVYLASKVLDGAFALYCPRPLLENYGYPSYAIFIDVDGDGGCGAGDAAYQMQLYGWNSDIAEEVPEGGWATIPAAGVPGSMGPPIGSTAGDFCAGYFE